MFFLSSKKTNEINSTLGTIVVKSNFLVRFFGKIEDTKKDISKLTDLLEKGKNYSNSIVGFYTFQHLLSILQDVYGRRKELFS